MFSAFDPYLMKGHIDKFRVPQQHQHQQQQQHQHGGFRKRMAPSPIPHDLRDKIRRLPESLRKVMVVIEGVPPGINFEDNMRLAVAAFGVVRRVECDVEARICRVVFGDESEALRCCERLNEIGIQDAILKCHLPAPDPLADI